MDKESIAVVGLDLGTSIEVKRGLPNLKVLITHLLLALEVWYGKPTYRKSCAGNLLVWLDLTFGPSDNNKFQKKNFVIITDLTNHVFSWPIKRL